MSQWCRQLQLWLVGTPWRSEGAFTPTQFGFKLSDFTLWSKSKRQAWKLPRTVFWTKRQNLDPTKRGGVSLDQTEPQFGSCPVWKYCFIKVQTLQMPMTGSYCRQPGKRKTSCYQNKEAHRITRRVRCFLRGWQRAERTTPSENTDTSAEKRAKKEKPNNFECAAVETRRG